MLKIISPDQSKVLDYIKLQLIGPKGGKYEQLDDNPVDLYLMGMIHPVDKNENTPVDSDEQIEGFFQNKPPSFGFSLYLDSKGGFSLDISCAQYKERKILNTVFLDKLRLRVLEEESNKPTKIISEIDEIFNALTASPDNQKDLISKANKINKSLNRSINEKISLKTWSRVPYDHQDNVLRPKNNITDLYLFDNKVRINIIWRPFKSGFITTVTMINNVEKSNKYVEDQLFQSKIKVIKDMDSILPYPLENNMSHDSEEEELELMYRNHNTFAVGHSCAVDWLSNEGNVVSLSSKFLPSEVVKPVITVSLEKSSDRSVLNLQFLSGDELTKSALKKHLLMFVDEYKLWAIKESEKEIGSSSVKARDRILSRIKNSIKRINKGIDIVVGDNLIFDAFKMANLVMLMQMVHGSEFSKDIKNKDEQEFKAPNYRLKSYSKYNWRPFQLAFFLLIIESLINKDSQDRNVVDLIWFPTGGGKTEAYLAVSAFELLYRRMKLKSSGAGTVVIKRYPLRLLTAQQFQRAAILICACEKLRRDNLALLGKQPYSIGLWVGGDSSPNDFTNNRGTGSFQYYKDALEAHIPENKFQVQKCPWCGTRIIPRRQSAKGHYGIKATETSFSFYCPTTTCEFHNKLPMTVVDEDMYKNPPSFIIGTIDKFARMSWTEKPKAFFGIGHEYAPPSLIIQDEMHLIAGPLGTIAGIYEAAIDSIIYSIDGSYAKKIAATATIRRADEQITRLYALEANIFPSPGIDAEDSYFARVDNQSPGRMYVGVMGQSSTQTTSIVETASMLAQVPVDLNLSPSAKDAYWTQVVYHNSKKELSKTITMASDDFPARLKMLYKGNRRNITNIEELSGNKQGDELTDILERMNMTIQDHPSEVIDILPCTNMISVGVDVPRLGLIMMHGQPKTTSEYIQASSRVGRDKVPGVVVTVYSSARPRDRSHYEGFISYHKSLYKFVEPTSVTPYAEPARDRALHAALVILMRYVGGIGGNTDACLFKSNNPSSQKIIKNLILRMQKADPSEEKSIEGHVYSIVKKWDNLIEEYPNKLQYSNSSGKQFQGLLCDFDKKIDDSWPTLHSMRGVDAEIDIVIYGED
jgi:hypothetical protein